MFLQFRQNAEAGRRYSGFRAVGSLHDDVLLPVPFDRERLNAAIPHVWLDCAMVFAGWQWQITLRLPSVAATLTSRFIGWLGSSLVGRPLPFYHKTARPTSAGRTNSAIRSRAKTSAL